VFAEVCKRCALHDSLGRFPVLIATHFCACAGVVTYYCACLCAAGLQVGMNPMKLPEGVAEELELLDEIGEIYNSRQQQQAGGPVGFGGSTPGHLQGLRPVVQQSVKTNVAGGSSSSGRSSSGTSTSNGAAATSCSRERLQQFRKQQQQQQQQQAAVDMSGMTMYSPDEFKKAFHVRDDDDDEQ